jgi:ubiquinone/menaquinone biosynthesis C-methylase UbiE
MMSRPIIFNGNIPQHYEDILTPFLFDGFSADLMQRIDFSAVRNALELASGTGSLTRQLVKNLPPGARLLASDLQPEMLEVAKHKINNENVSWDVVDMTDIPYAGETFDLVICQFGLMLVPDKLKALQEIYRVLTPGGKLVFTVWGEIENNPVWNISGKVIASFLGGNPMLQNPGPFSLASETETMKLLEEAGFKDIKTTSVTQTGNAGSASVAARGFIQGLPVFAALNQKDPAMIGQVEVALEKEFVAALGNHPLKSALTAWVFVVNK